LIDRGKVLSSPPSHFGYFMNQIIKPPAHSQVLRYYPHIDGLRAIAVLGVLAYHYGATAISGGFTGVDVFFVISGFLITSDLKNRIEAGTFSIIGFYDRRIRRIVPALLVMLAATSIAGWFLLMPGDYKTLGESASYAAFGLSNLYFLAHSGYFDQVSEMQPLLHTWSLGVEEQFYVAWPVLLWAGMKLIKSKRLFLWLFAAGLALGFAYACRKLGFDPGGDFYLPHPRAWELAIGGILAFVPMIGSRRAIIVAEIVGLALIGWSFFALNAAAPFPGLNAAYACLGAALLLWPKKQDGPLASMLTFKPLRGIGLISYSLYLWHWPVLVLFRNYNNGLMPSPVEAVVLAALSFALAFLSWKFVENPVRDMRPIRWKTVGAGVIACALIAVAGNGIAMSGGFANRLSPEFQSMSSLETMWKWDCPETRSFVGLKTSSCVLGDPWETASSHALLWGDSHALTLAPLLDVAAKGTGTSILILQEATDGVECPAVIDNEKVIRTRPDMPEYSAVCAADRQAATSWLDANPDVDKVIFTGAWPNLSTDIHGPDGQLSRTIGNNLISVGLGDLIDRLSRPGRKFVLIADVPQWPSDPTPCATQMSAGAFRRACPNMVITKAQFDAQQAADQRIFADAAAQHSSNSVAILPGDRLCSSDCVNAVDGQFIYRDDGHLRRNLSLRTKQDLSVMMGLPQIFTTRAGVAAAD
jgi:peptidoglycan/LPS O-acetylase OafA/YrhL